MPTNNASRRGYVSPRTNAMHQRIYSRRALQRYATFKPTPFDRNISLPNSAWYIAPVSETRDSDVYTRANFEAMRRLLLKADPHRHHHEMRTFKHWGPGWFSIVLVRPRSKAWRVACECAEKIAETFYIDEDLTSQMETEEAIENFSPRDVVDDLGDEVHQEATRQFIRDNVTLEFMFNQIHATTETRDGRYCWSLSTNSRDDMAAFLWELREYARHGK